MGTIIGRNAITRYQDDDGIIWDSHLKRFKCHPSTWDIITATEAEDIPDDENIPDNDENVPVATVYECEVCKKVFSKKIGLVGHSKVHKMHDKE